MGPAPSSRASHAAPRAELAKRPSPDDLTIALCTVGRPGFLQAALESLIATTPPGVRLHVVFNGTDDDELVADVERLISRWDGPSELTRLSERLDITASHNTALEAATTEFITFMGDDDLVLEPRLERLLDRFWTTEPTPVVIGSFCRRVSGTADDPRYSTNKDYGPATIAEWERLRRCDELIEVVFPSAIYMTSALRAIGGFDARFGSAMDVATFTMLGRTDPVLADPRRSFAHRIHDASTTTARADEHAQRVRYVQACMAAQRAGREEPNWDVFAAADRDRSQIGRALGRRRVLSANLFRQGGAAAASGAKLRGAALVSGAAILSPGTVVDRFRSHAEASDAGEPVVTILVKNCNRYRVPFYQELRTALADRSIELRLVVGGGLAEDAAKGDLASLPWAEHRDLRTIELGGASLVWQPGFDLALAADLIITEQASKQLFNAVLAAGQRVARTRHAFWGHGRNFQASVEGGGGESLKRAMTRRAHWFFAYNDLSAAAVAELGFPEDRITAVMNSTDTTHIRAVRDSLPEGTPAAVREELGMGSGPVVLYLGGIYPPKRPDFLVETALELRTRIEDLELLVIGDGSSGHVIADAARRNTWIHHVGAAYGDERIRLASVCDLQLMPGLVGLNIVDAFALGLPTMTTDIDYHSPEIDYLRPGVNGMIAPGDTTPTGFAEMVESVLRDPATLAKLQQGAEESALELGVEKMAERFADGVVKALRVDD